MFVTEEAEWPWLQVSRDKARCAGGLAMANETTRGTGDIPLFSSPGGSPGMPVSLPLPQIAGFDVGGILGEGGMGTIYEAWQLQPRRRVALKLLRYGLLSPTLLRRFEQEVEILGRIEHPVVTRLYETGSVEYAGCRVPYFAMEYVEGCSILEYARQRQLSVRERAALLKRVVDGVHVAHQKGIIHRDIKPANVLVNEEGQPKILDFGVARLEQEDIQITLSLSQGGGLLGTLPYMSPEQAGGGSDEVDVRSDIYSLGILAYELFSGQRPLRLDALALHEAIRVIQTQEPMRLGSVDRSLRGDIDAIVGKAIEKDRERRYASATAMADDLQRYLQNRSVEARVPSLGYQASKFIRRHKLMAGAGALVMVSLTLGLAFAQVGMIRARRAELEARRAERKAVAESDRAQANLQQAMDAVERFTTVVAETQLGKTSEALPVRRQLLADAVSFYERFVEDNQGDPRVHAELTRALIRMVDLQTLMGETEESRRVLGEAVLNEAARLKIEPETEESLRSQALSWSQLGARLVKSRELERALAAYEQSTALYHRALEIDPQDEDCRRELARGWRDVADLVSRMGRTAQAENAYRASLEAMKGLVESQPGKADYRRDYAHGLSAYAQYLGRVGERGRAVEALEEAGRHFSWLVQNYPQQDEFRRDQARYFSEHGEMLARAGKTGDAVKALEESNRIYGDLVAQNPGIADYRRDLAISCSKLGGLYGQSKRMDEARRAFERGAILGGDLAADYPLQPDYRREWARAWSEYGLVLRSAGELESAMSAIGQAVAILEALVEGYPDHFSYRLDLARSTEEMGRTCQEAGDLDQAGGQYLKAREQYAQLLQEDPGNPSVLASLGYLLSHWADMLAPDEARQRLAEAEALWLDLVARFPDRASNQKALVYVQGRLKRLPWTGGGPEPTAMGNGGDSESPEGSGEEGTGTILPLWALDRSRLIQEAGIVACVTGLIRSVPMDNGSSGMSFIKFALSDRDFCGVVRQSALPAFQAQFGTRLETLVGRHVEVRGIVGLYRGNPQIILTRPDQVRVIGDQSH